MQKKLHVKVGDTVQVMSGAAKGKKGKILSIDRNKNRAIVESVNIVKKHVKPSASNPKGNIEDREAAIHLSNLMLLVNDKPTRVGRRTNSVGKLVRFSKKTGEEIKS
jgi:large subunit ribosomal protein L24